MNTVTASMLARHPSALTLLASGQGPCPPLNIQQSGETVTRDGRAVFDGEILGMLALAAGQVFTPNASLDVLDLIAGQAIAAGGVVYVIRTPDQADHDSDQETGVGIVMPGGAVHVGIHHRRITRSCQLETQLALDGQVIASRTADPSEEPGSEGDAQLTLNPSMPWLSGADLSGPPRQKFTVTVVAQYQQSEHLEVEAVSAEEALREALRTADAQAIIEEAVNHDHGVARIARDECFVVRGWDSDPTGNPPAPGFLIPPVQPCKRYTFAVGYAGPSSDGDSGTFYLTSLIRSVGADIQPHLTEQEWAERELLDELEEQGQVLGQEIAFVKLISVEEENADE